MIPRLALVVALLSLPSAARAFDAAALQRLRSGETNLRGADLSGANLDRLQGRALDFTGANLSGATLRNARLVASLFNGANLTGVVATGSLFGDVSFAGATLDGADFSSSSHDQSGFARARLRRTRFVGARLTRSQFTGASLQDVGFASASLTDVGFRDAGGVSSQSVTGLVFDHAEFRNVLMENLELSRASFVSARLGGLRGAGLVLVDCSLLGADLGAAAMAGLTFRRDDLRSANFSRARAIELARFDQIRCDASTLWPPSATVRLRAACAATGAPPPPATSITATPVNDPPASPAEPSPDAGGAATGDPPSAPPAAPPATMPSESPLSPRTTVDVLNAGDPAIAPLAGAIVARFRPRLHACYTQALRTTPTPTPQGQLTGQVSVDAGGIVRGFATTPGAANTLNHDGMIACVRGAFRGDPVGEPGAPVRVEVRLTFTPR